MNENLNDKYIIVKKDIEKANINQFIKSIGQSLPIDRVTYKRTTLYRVVDKNGKNYVICSLYDTSNSTLEPRNKRVQGSVINCAKFVDADVLALYEVNGDFAVVHWKLDVLKKSNAKKNQGAKVKLGQIKKCFIDRNTVLSNQFKTRMLFKSDVYWYQNLSSIIKV